MENKRPVAKPAGTVAALSRRLYLSVDTVRTQMNASAASRLSELSRLTAPQVPWQCVTQMKNPAVCRRASEALSQALCDALKSTADMSAPTMEQAVKDASNAILAPETSDLVQEVVLQTATMSCPEALELVAKMAVPGDRTSGPLQDKVESALSTVLLESHQKAVSAISHYVLQQAVEMVLQTSVMPSLLSRVMETFGKQLLDVVQSDDVRPALPATTRERTRSVARAAATETVQKCLTQAMSRNGPVRVLCVGPPGAAATPGPGAAQKLEVATVATQPLVPQPKARPLAYKQIATKPPPSGPGPAPSPAPSRDLTKQTTVQEAVGVPPGHLTPATTPEDADGLAKATVFVPNEDSSAWQTYSLSLPAAAGPSGVPVTVVPVASDPPPLRLKTPSCALAAPFTGIASVSWAPNGADPKRLKQEQQAPAVSPAKALAPAPAPAPASAATIASLPDEILVEILRHLEPLLRLTVCRLVCRRWHAVCSGDTMWSREVLRYEGHKSLKSKFSRVLTLAPQLAMVDCERVSRKGPRRAPFDVPRHVTKALLETSCRVRGLRIATLDLDPEYVISVLRRHAPNLEELDLVADADLVDLSAPHTPCLVLHTIDQMPALRSLRLTGDFPIEFNFGPRPLGAPPRMLEDLDLSGYTSCSPHTACSLLQAHHSTLRRVVLQRAGVEELIDASLCPNLSDLTVPCPVLALYAPASLHSVYRLTLTRGAPVLDLSPAGAAAVRKDLHRSFMLPHLCELVLDGVAAPADIPKTVRATFRDIQEITFRGTNMSGKDMTALLREMPALESVVFEREPQLSEDVLSVLPHLGLNMKRIRIVRSLVCTAGVCCKPAFKFLSHFFPRADIQVDHLCRCDA